MTQRDAVKKMLELRLRVADLAQALNNVVAEMEDVLDSRQCIAADDVGILDEEIAEELHHNGSLSREA